jgi:hypothetical protein
MQYIVFKVKDRSNDLFLDEAVGFAKVEVATLVRGPMAVTLTRGDDNTDYVGTLHLDVEVSTQHNRERTAFRQHSESLINSTIGFTKGRFKQ